MAAADDPFAGDRVTPDPGAAAGVLAPPAAASAADDPFAADRVAPPAAAAPPVDHNAPVPSWLHTGEVAGSGLLRGGAELAGLPGDLTRLATAGRVSPWWLPTSPTAVDWLSRQAANVGVPLATPQTPVERYINAAAEGVGSTLPLALIPGAEAALPARAALAAAQGAGAGLGGEAGRELTPGHPMVGGLVGALAGGAGAGTAVGGAGRLAAALSGTTENPLAAYDALNIQPRLAGDITGSRNLQRLQSAALTLPGGTRAHTALDETIAEFGDAVENTASQMLPSGAAAANTLQDAGTTLQSQARQWLTSWRSDSKNAWDAVGAKIPDATPVDMTGVDQALRATQAAMPNLPATAQILTDPVFDQLSRSLQSDIAASGGAAPWADVRAMQQRVGDHLEGSLVAGDPAAAQWKHVYGALSDATGNTAAANGAAAEYAAARDLTGSGHQYIDNVLNRVISSKNPAQNAIAPEAAASFALGGSGRGGTVLQQIRDQMPDAADALGAYKLRAMAKPSPGGQVGDVASPNSFLTDYNRLAPEARTALFPDPQTTTDLANLRTVADSMRDTYQRFGNPSRTAQAAGHALPVFGLVSGAGEGARQGYEEGGLSGALKGALAGALAGGVLGFAPGYGVANLAARPSLTRLLAQPSLAATTPLTGRLLRQTAATVPPLSFSISGQQPP